MTNEKEELIQDAIKEANELVNKYLIATPIVFHIDDAKICALICVNEILEALMSTHDDYDMWEFWEEVRNQIQNL